MRMLSSFTASWLRIGTTSLVAEFTNTYFAPPLTHLSAHGLWPAFAPFAPQPLSLIHPVQLSAFAARLTATNITAAIIFTSFFIPSLLDGELRPIPAPEPPGCFAPTPGISRAQARFRAVQR